MRRDEDPNEIRARSCIVTEVVAAVEEALHRYSMHFSVGGEI